MSEYVLLLHSENVDFAKLSPSDAEDLMARFVSWTNGLRDAGRLRGVERLKGDRGKTVRKRGDAVVVDGPYTEGKELVVGLYVIAAPSLDAACEEAARCPLIAIGGGVEVRETDVFPKS